MKSNQSNIEVKVERKEGEIPALGRVLKVPNQGKMKGGLLMQQDTKSMVQQSGALQNLRAFLQQSSQNMVKPENFIFPPVHNTPAMNMCQMGGGNLGMMQKYSPLLPPPPSFSASVQNLKQISIGDQSSDTNWPMPPSTQLSMGLPNLATNYPLRGSSDLSVNSPNRHPLLRKNEIMQYFMNRHKMAARSVENEYPNMINAHHPATFNYQLQAGISGGRESCYSNTFYPGRLPVMLSNQVATKEDVISTCYPRQGTTPTFCVSQSPVYYNRQGLIEQFAGSGTGLQEPTEENHRNKVKHIVKQEETVLFPTHQYPSKRVMNQNSREFIETLHKLSGRSGRTSLPSSRTNRHRGRGNTNNPPLYSIRSKASDFHVDPILRAFAISMKKKGKDNRQCSQQQKYQQEL